MKLTSIFFLIIGLTSITFFYFDIYFSVATSVAIATFILFLFYKILLGLTHESRRY